jgi:uncharacterized protein Veg
MAIAISILYLFSRRDTQITLMAKILFFLGILSLSQFSFCQEYCLKVVKKDKKEFIIQPGQKVKVEIVNAKNRAKSTKCKLIEVNDSSFIVKPLRGKNDQAIVKYVNDVEYLGFKTRSSIFWGTLYDFSTILLLIAPVSGYKDLYFMGQFRVESFNYGIWFLEISRLDIPLNPNRKTAYKIKLKN